MLWWPQISHCYVRWLWKSFFIPNDTIFEDSSLLGCDSVLLDEWFQMFQRNMVPSFSTLHSSCTAWPWRWRHYNPSRCQELLTNQCSIIVQKFLNTQQHRYENLTPHTVNYLYRVIHIEWNQLCIVNLWAHCVHRFFPVFICHTVWGSNPVGLHKKHMLLQCLWHDAANV
jgi:hypothetical protein